jgi:hypothetical protein
MKLKLNTKNLNKPKPLVPYNSPYKSPIGYWKVTTEGDCEGRTTTDLGCFYGHVAEIAFSLADRCLYSLRFTPGDENLGGVGFRPAYEAKKKSVWISLGVDSYTWGMSSESRAVWFQKWLDITNPVIKVLGKSESACYYASVYLELKD